jgi:hypothetical protein
MLTAIVLMCRLSATECDSSDAHRIAAAIDTATEHEGLRSHLVEYSYKESHWQLHPRAESWDARAGKARGPWQLWFGGDADLTTQAVTWLRNVQQAGLASVDSSPSRAARRAQAAQRLLDEPALR